ncbi:MAG: hypothetical protein IJM92_17960 [Fibrobacter sp.]|uniref:hypothetical protein n=1 Tax=Fibrobacter sp. TaxID=35828 RepID=UPI0025C5255F|nr:hypothetical protein [Fibrobacter sp.]MBQ3443278.1 hypothetical protein [Selenomonadaceae bacterium]MBQ7081501.1 hypothetical protein [Fibrobacter sp.]
MEKISKDILDSFEIEKFQTNFRLDSIVSPNDKLTRNLFNLPAEEYFDALQKGISIAVTETTIRGKKIQTHFKLNGGGLAALKRPLNEYDRTIFDICNSAREAKFIGITRDSLFRAVIGGKTNQYPRPNQANAILESLKRLMTVIEIDFSQTRDKIPKYNSVKPILISPILPCRILHDVLVNGQLTSIIKFTDESPLMTIARAKKQIITYYVNLRDITGQNNTTLVIMIKSYLIRRVLEILAHNMTPTITFYDLFKHCELLNASRWQKQDARKIVLGVMENLKSEGIIKSFALTKKDGSYYSISLTF